MYARPVNTAKSPPASFTHEQTTPSTTWSITHNLNRAVAVTTLDSAGEEIVGNVTHVGVNVVSINFTVAVSGRAVVS